MRGPRGGSAAVAAIEDYRNLAAAGTTRRGPAAFLPFDAWPQPGGLIRTTTVAVPARGSVVLAKATVMTALWTAVGTVVSAGSFLVFQAVLDGRHAGVPITHPGVPRALVVSALPAPVCALIGLGLGVLIRHGAATMATCAFTLLMLPTVFSQSERRDV